MTGFGSFFQKVYREFGLGGMLTYLGGIIILYGFMKEPNIWRQILLGIFGFMLLGLATYISYLRLQIQKQREKALIDMTQNIGNRLAEQIAKGLPSDQVSAILKKIRQLQMDLVDAIVRGIGKQYSENN